ncbi:hypothetical protein ACTFIW_002243 [Dictyostelium discoideum]
MVPLLQLLASTYSFFHWKGLVSSLPNGFKFYVFLVFYSTFSLLLQTKEYVEANNYNKGAILGQHFNNLFHKFIQEQCSGDIYWGRKNIFHNYARFCLESLHLLWPDSVVSPADDYPFLLGVLKIQKCPSIATNQTSNQTNQKKQ